MSIDLAAIDAIDVHTHAQVPRHGDLNAVQSDRPVIVHHEGDFLSRGRDCPIQSLLPAQWVILRPIPDGPDHSPTEIEP